MKLVANKLAVIGILLLTLGITACTEPTEITLPSEQEMSSERMEANVESMGIEFPINWEEMNMEEKMEFMQSQDKNRTIGEGMGNRTGENTDRMKTRFEEAGVEMPENWMEMSREERQVFMNENEM